MARQRRGMTMRELAAALDVHERTLAGYEAETPRSYPSLEKVRRLCEILDVTIGELLDPEDVAA